MTDAELIQRAQRGDVAAFESLVRTHTPAVRRFAYAFTRNWSDADDLAQEALIKAYRALGSFRGDSAFSTWLFRITRNVCLDASRSRQGKERGSEDELDAAAHELPHEQRPDALAAQREREAMLWEGLRALPTEFRAAVVFFDIEGLSYEEVAAIENVPIGTVRSRLSRGRERLRELVTALERDGARRAARGAAGGGPDGGPGDGPDGGARGPADGAGAPRRDAGTFSPGAASNRVDG